MARIRRRERRDYAKTEGIIKSAFSNAAAGKLSVSATGFREYSVEITPDNPGPLSIVLQPAPVLALETFCSMID
jgi:hypothetical protein